MHQIDYSSVSLEAIAGAFREKNSSPNDLAEWCIERHQKYDNYLGAYREWQAERIRNISSLATKALSLGYDLGPLQGIPFSAKDLYGVPGYRTFAGSPNQLPQEWEFSGPIVTSLLSQLAVTAGKTHSVEFAYGGLGTNAHWPAPRNPWDPKVHRVPGGSSSGAGVSIIEGSAMFALGTDTAGSVRIPASLTGTAGLKATYGRWPLDGIVPLSPSVDSPGVLARSIKDVAYVFSAIEWAMKRVRIRLDQLDLFGLRIGIPKTFFWDDCSSGIADQVRQALAELETKGARLIPIDIPEVDEAFGYFRQGALAPPEIYGFLKTHLPDWINTLDPNVSMRIKAGEDLPAWEWLYRRERFEQLSITAAEHFRRVDLVATPTVAITPPTVDELKVAGAYPKANIMALRNTSVINLLGLCAVTLPVGLDQKGLPVGLQLVGGSFQEPKLLSQAIAVEATLGTAEARLGKPPL